MRMIKSSGVDYLLRELFDKGDGDGDAHSSALHACVAVPASSSRFPWTSAIVLCRDDWNAHERLEGKSKLTKP